MRVKTSVTLSRNTIDSLDELAGEGLSRSRVIEIAVAELLERQRRRRRDDADRRILNRRAEVLNREMDDILDYQIEP